MGKDFEKISGGQTPVPPLGITSNDGTQRAGYMNLLSNETTSRAEIKRVKYHLLQNIMRLYTKIRS